jgi:hypothetical protein
MASADRDQLRCPSSLIEPTRFPGPGPLAASLPAISTVDPLFSIALGVIIYDEQIRHGLTAGVGLGALLLVLGVAIIQLSRAGLAAPEHTATP